MAFTPYFSVSLSSLITTFVVQDDSVGSDAAITQRRIYLQLSDGTYLVPTGTTTSYVNWPIVLLATDTIDLAVLNTDYAINITVQWLNVSGVVLYTKSVVYGFANYEKQFLYNLTSQDQASNPPIIQDTNYLMNKLNLFQCVVSGDNAIAQAADIASAQQCYDRGMELIANANFNF